jgi:hypothetical protein
MEAVLVYSKFLRKNVGQETKIYIMTEEEADAMLEKMPTGACLLRLDATLDSPKAPYVLSTALFPSPLHSTIQRPCKTPDVRNANGRLTCSYKYFGLTFHHLLENIQLTLKERKHTFYCHASNKNAFQYIRKVFMEFLPRLQMFIEEFTTNQNFVGACASRALLSQQARQH